MRRLIVLGVACLSLGVGSARAQTCLHGRDESTEEQERRQQALAAVRIVNTAQANRPRFAPLAELGDSPAVRAMRAEGGPLGDAARAMRFDREELLPGWRVHFVLGAQSYSMILRDARDACGFAYVSSDDGLILQAYPVTRGRSLLRPTTQ